MANRVGGLAVDADPGWLAAERRGDGEPSGRSPTGSPTCWTRAALRRVTPVGTRR